MFSRSIAAVALVCLASSPLSAEVARIEVQSRADLLGGKPFGDAGAYEKLTGKVHFEIDPTNTANRIITDIRNAPRNARGRVEFSSDFFLIRPKQIERGNGTVLYEVSNRGGKGMLGFFNQGTGGLNPTSEADLGDGFLLNRGFTLLWLGWQFDVPKRDGLVRVYPPVATENGKPIAGIVRSEVIVARKAFDASLADRDHVAYTVADPNDPTNTLTVRETIEGPRRIVPRSEWQFARFTGGAAVPDPTHVYLASGFEPSKIYEVVYTSRNPPVVGVGPAAIRDTISMLKYGSADAWTMPAGAIRRAIGFGVSQSGRFLRTYLYYGFNEDERHRKVFDGVMAHVAGAGRGSFNLRFAQPSRDGHPFLNKTVDPPEVNGEFPLLVPQVDRDGNELAGLKMPEVSVPLATYTGWNLFNAESGPTNLLSSMQGSYIPLARTRAERERTKDPRPSIEERYQNRDQYLGLVSAAAKVLVQGGYLRQEDVSAIVEHAGRHWDLAWSGSGGETNASRP